MNTRRHAARDDTLFGKYRKPIRCITGRHSVVGTCCAARCSNPGGGRGWGETFRTRSDRPSGASILPSNGYRVSSGRIGAGGWRWPPTLIQRLGYRKNRVTLPLCFHGMVSGEQYQYVVQELKEVSLCSGIYYRYSALRPVWVEIRSQSGDWYSSGTLHPGQILRGSLPLLSSVVRYSASNYVYEKCNKRKKTASRHFNLKTGLFVASLLMGLGLLGLCANVTCTQLHAYVLFWFLVINASQKALIIDINRVTYSSFVREMT
jgi:hypothetical protein